jgi:hypothetical protein
MLPKRNPGAPSFERTLRWLLEYRHLSRADFDRIRNVRLEDVQEFIGGCMGFWVPGADAPMNTSFSFGGPSLEYAPLIAPGQITFSVHLPLGIRAAFHDRTALEAFIGFMNMETVTHA